MGARRPVRPAPGHAMILPRVKDDASQRAFDHVKQAAQQTIATTTALQTQVTATGGGRLLAVQTITGSGTYVPTPGTMAVDLEGVACGGGGGGGQGVNGCGAGGTSGSYFIKRITSDQPITGGAYSAPTVGGAAGSGAGGNGGAGPDATLVIQGVTYTLKGGPGGGGMPAPPGTTFTSPGGTVGGSSTGDVPTSQDNGAPGMFLSGSFGIAGEGGASPLGAGGTPSSTASPGAGGNGQGFGGGGGGGSNGAGGVGAGAGWIIKEYS